MAGQPGELETSDELAAGTGRDAALPSWVLRAAGLVYPDAGVQDLFYIFS